MKNLFQKIVKELDQEILKKNDERREEDTFEMKKIQIQLLGQLSLFTHPDHLEAKLFLVGTVDVDAKVVSDYPAFRMFKEIIRKHGLVYDEDSEKIWLPKESTYTEIFNTSRVQCFALDPLYSLTSKAIKGPEKNRILVRQGLDVFGSELENLIKKYKGNVDYFKKE